MSWVAEQFVVFEAADGTRHSGRIAVSLPVRQATGEWGCRIIADGVVELPGLIFGVSSLQSLVLGLQLLATLLHAFLERGGRALEPPDGSDARLDLTFGPLWPSR